MEQSLCSRDSFITARDRFNKPLRFPSRVTSLSLSFVVPWLYVVFSPDKQKSSGRKSKITDASILSLGRKTKVPLCTAELFFPRFFYRTATDVSRNQYAWLGFDEAPMLSRRVLKVEKSAFFFCLGCDALFARRIQLRRDSFLRRDCGVKGSRLVQMINIIRRVLFDWRTLFCKWDSIP